MPAIFTLNSESSSQDSNSRTSSSDLSAPLTNLAPEETVSSSGHQSGHTNHVAEIVQHIKDAVKTIYDGIENNNGKKLTQISDEDATYWIQPTRVETRVHIMLKIFKKYYDLKLELTAEEDDSVKQERLGDLHENIIKDIGEHIEIEKHRTSVIDGELTRWAAAFSTDNEDSQTLQLDPNYGVCVAYWRTLASDAQDSIRSFAGRLIVDYIESQFSDEADMENFMNRNTFEITPQYNPDIPLGRLSDLVLQWIFKAVIYHSGLDIQRNDSPGSEEVTSSEEGSVINSRRSIISSRGSITDYRGSDTNSRGSVHGARENTPEKTSVYSSGSVPESPRLLSDVESGLLQDAVLFQRLINNFLKSHPLGATTS